jgi:PhnB protein
VGFLLAPPLQAVMALGQNLEEWFATWTGEIGYEIRDLKIVSDGEVAYAHSLNHMTGTKTDGAAVDLWFRETLGLRKIDGRWRIAHEHESVPFAMDGSFKAEVHLKP